MQRRSRDEVFLGMARELSTLSTCVSRRVGCVIVDEHNRVIASGYNGIPSGITHVCMESGCQRKDHAPGERLDKCLAIHAEANALLHCSDVKKVAAIYIWGASPCFECAKLICNTSTCRVIVNEFYTPQHVAAVQKLFDAKRIKLEVLCDEC